MRVVKRLLVLLWCVGAVVVGRALPSSLTTGSEGQLKAGTACLPTALQQLLVVGLYTPEFRTQQAAALRAMTDPPLAIAFNQTFVEMRKGFKVDVTLHDLSWGPLSDLTLPETVTLTDIDGAPAWLPVSGDGARLATSHLAFASAAQGRLSARCSFCPPFEGGTDCTDWRKYCDLTATVSMTVAGTVRAAGDTCVLADPSCADAAGDVSECVFATATAAAANVTGLTMTVSDIRGDHLCSAAGVTEAYLNDVLRRYSPQLRVEVEKTVSAGVVGGLNHALASQHVRPYSAHPSALAAQR